MPGKTLDFGNGPDFRRVGSLLDLERTGERLAGSTVGVLFVHNADPVAYRPMFGGAMGKANVRVGVGDTLTATMQACDIVLPLSHSLESWDEQETAGGARCGTADDQAVARHALGR